MLKLGKQMAGGVGGVDAEELKVAPVTLPTLSLLTTSGPPKGQVSRPGAGLVTAKGEQTTTRAATRV